MSQESKLEIELRPIFDNIDVLAEEGTVGLIHSIAEGDIDPLQNKLDVLAEAGIIEEKSGGISLTDAGKQIHKQLEEVDNWSKSSLDEVENITVLVGEDRAISQDLYGRILSNAEIEFTMTKGDFMDALSERPIDVIIMERMFDRDTRKLINDIREVMPDHPIIIVTTLSPESSVLGWDIDDYLVKPAGVDELRRSISRSAKASHLPLKQRQLLLFLAKKMALEKNESWSELEEDSEYQQVVDELKRTAEEF